MCVLGGNCGGRGRGWEVSVKLCVGAIAVILPAQSLTNEKRFGCQFHFRLFRLAIILIYFSCVFFFLLVYEARVPINSSLRLWRRSERSNNITMRIELYYRNSRTIQYWNKYNIFYRWTRRSNSNNIIICVRFILREF